MGEKNTYKLVSLTWLANWKGSTSVSLFPIKFIESMTRNSENESTPIVRMSLKYKYLEGEQKHDRWHTQSRNMY